MRLNRDGPNSDLLICSLSHVCFQWFGLVGVDNCEGLPGTEVVLLSLLSHHYRLFRRNEFDRSIQLIGAIAGIIADSFFLAFEFVCCGGIVAAIVLVFASLNAQVCIPDWPMYNRKPIEWAKSDKTD